MVHAKDEWTDPVCLREGQSRSTGPLIDRRETHCALRESIDSVIQYIEGATGTHHASGACNDLLRWALTNER